MPSPPRVVVVTRPTDFEQLVIRHGTREQARFFLAQRDEKIEEVEARHHDFAAILVRISQAIPLAWRRARITRADLARFVWEPGDLVVAVGQDGLVANVAKYLAGQPVIGVSSDPARNPGVLVRHRIDAFPDLLRRTAAEDVDLELRTMVEARLDDGQRLLALNEIFAGHQTHQSARYRIACAQLSEHHSSSGVIVATGTGATGWASSIARGRTTALPLPAPTDRALAYLVREAWASPATGTKLTDGVLGEGSSLQLTSEMNEGGVLFGDGIEHDRLHFGWGIHATVAVARERLHLVVS